MNSIEAAAQAAQLRAWEIIRETNIIEIWSSIGATIHLVGSLKMGLLLNHRDIDFHIYTDPFNLSDSFTAISRLAENRHIRSIRYTNLEDAEDRCIEWHAVYDDASGAPWHLDMIHILPDSRYAGHFERMAERITAVLTDETRDAILRIKAAIPLESRVMGVQIYQAVIEGGVRDIDSFQQWLEAHPCNGISQWMP
jgi:hypothetical protein